MSETRAILQKRYDFIFKCGIGAPLNQVGFARQGSRFVKWVGEDFCFIVSPYRNRISRPGKSRFSIACFVFVAAEWRIFSEQAWSVERRIGATIDVNFNQISFPRFPQWWELSATDPPGADQTTVEDLRRIFESCVIPWFEQFRTLRDIGDYLSSPDYGPGRARYSYREIVQTARDLCKAAIAYWAAGDFERARRMLDLAERTVANPQSRASTAELRCRLERLMAGDESVASP
ncbi:MAG: hypothetical protein KIT16_12285 [Rhodospirillaceae bacterium]|nr:hypothetical protein [Rhodospirillaceae bacterium]